MILLVLGGVGTIGGAAMLVFAFRRGQAGDAAGERRLFRWAIGCAAVGSALLVAALMVDSSSPT